MSIKIEKNKDLVGFSTFKIGGPAKFFVEIKTKEDLLEAFDFAEGREEKVFILGGGSNILINDKGIEGLVAKMANDEIKIRSDRVDCGAGAVLARVNAILAGEGLSGFQWATGIPRATIGGSIRGNGGAFGYSISDYLETLEVFDIEKKSFAVWSKKDCRFIYRGSAFKQNDNFLIFSATFKLPRKSSQEIKKEINDIFEKRNKNQSKLPSAGCVFKNIEQEYLEEANPELFKEAVKNNKVSGGKVPSAWLIDILGLKGKRIGGAKISLEHANFIVNTGKATAEDVATLISFIKQKVRNNFKVQLHKEIQYFGFD